MSKEYQKILLPLVDVYEEAGDQVLGHYEATKEDEKNLLVFPFDFLDDLNDAPSHESLGPAKEDALKQIKEIIHNGTTKVQDTNGLLLSNFSQGLDILFVDYVGRRSEANKFSLTNLLEELKTQFNTNPALITSSSKDHIKYASRNVEVKDPAFLLVNQDIVNEGVLKGNEELFRELNSANRNTIPLEKACEILGRDLHPNQFIESPFKISLDLLKDQPPEEQKSIYKYAKVTGKICKNASGSRMELEDLVVSQVPYSKRDGYQLKIGKNYVNNIFKISPKDEEQYLAMQYGLLDPNISLLFLCGSQGSGKTLLSYVCAVDQILGYQYNDNGMRTGPGKTRAFDQILLLKPNDVVGGKKREKGYLPGDLFAKLKDDLKPYSDAHKESELGGRMSFKEMFLSPKFDDDFGPPKEKDRSAVLGGYWHPKKEMIELSHVGAMRGRSLKNTLFILDETQNYTPYETKTIIERAGPGCKIIILGDPAQVDNAGCTREKNGLTAAIKQYLDKPYSMLIKLSKNYRSQMSEDTSDWKVYSQ